MRVRSSGGIMTAGWVEGAAMAVVSVEEVITVIGLVRLTLVLLC